MSKILLSNMTNMKVIKDWLTKKVKNTTAKKDGRDVIKLVPHRSVGGVNLPGYEISQEWEVYLENAGIYDLALCHDVTDIAAQQKTFHYLDAEGKKRSYTPDLIFTVNNTRIVCEVKPLRYLLEKETREYLSILHRVLTREGYQFHFLTEDQLLNKPRCKNVKKIIRYKSHHLSQEIITSYRNLVIDKTITVKDLLEHVPTKYGLANIYAAIMKGFLCIDWDVKVGLDSEIYLPTTERRSLTYEQVSTSGRYGPILQRLVLEGGSEAERILAIKKSEGKQITNYNPLGFF